MGKVGTNWMWGAGCGMLLALAQVWWLSGWDSTTMGSGTPILWVCDRDAGSLCALDSKGLIVDEFKVRWPLEQVPRLEGTRWVLTAAEGPGSPGRRLAALGRAGKLGNSRWFLEAHGLRAGPAGAVRFLGRIDQGLFWLELDSMGRMTRWLPAGEALGWDQTSDGVALVGRRGVCWYGQDFSVRTMLLEPGSEILAHAEGIGGLWLWVRLGQGAGPSQTEVRLVHSDGSCSWRLDAGLLAPAAQHSCRLVAGDNRALWLLQGSGTVLRIDLLSRLRARARLQGPLVGACLPLAGELWSLSPGVVQRLDARGNPLPGQAGFVHLVGPPGLAQVSSQRGLLDSRNDGSSH